MGVSKNQGSCFGWCSDNKRPTVLGSKLKLLILGNSQVPYLELLLEGRWSVAQLASTLSLCSAACAASNPRFTQNSKGAIKAPAKANASLVFSSLNLGRALLCKSFVPQLPWHRMLLVPVPQTENGCSARQNFGCQCACQQNQ